MTLITITRSRGHIVRVKAEGHTGYAESGYDIVCAAVSALTEAAANGLREVAGIRVKDTTRDGYKEFSIGEYNQSTDAILETMALALKDIANQYPRYLKTEDQTK